MSASFTAPPRPAVLFTALLDVSMTRFATPVIAGVLYAAGVALVAFLTLGVLLAQLALGSWVLVAWPVTLFAAMIAVVIWRVTCELAVSLVATAAATNALVTLAKAPPAV